MSKSLRPLLAAVVAAGAIVASGSSALAAAPTGDFAQFKYCPYSSSAAESCLHSVSTSGSFKLGNATVPFTASTPVTFQGGFTVDANTLETTFYDASGADTLSKTKLEVPGGLAGLVDSGGLIGPLITLFNDAVAAENDVYATAELVGPAKFDYVNFIVGTGTTLELPVRVHLENPFLGSSCYIGSASDPVTLKLTDGTTAPPPPNTPISGTPGEVTTNEDATIATASGNTLVDNAFSVPAARGCGVLILDQLVISAAVNLKEGLPSAAGNNSASLTGTTVIADANAVRASVQ